ncbi:MAG: hypothetical protein R2856_03560 [Caldilineaceae bacterium]
MIGVAKGQIEIEPFTCFAASGATLAVPDVCFMEAFAYAERIEKHPGALRTLANEQVRGIWATSRLAASQHLQQTIEEAEIAYDFLILEFSRNLSLSSTSFLHTIQRSLLARKMTYASALSCAKHWISPRPATP